MPPEISLRHVVDPARLGRPSAWRSCATCCGAASFTFDEAVRGADRMTVAVTLFALLELYKRGEVDWEQDESFGEIDVHRPASTPARGALALAGAASADSAAAGLAG